MEILTILGPAGQLHKISLTITNNESSLTISATYESGDLTVPRGTTIINWTSYYEAPLGESTGFIDIGAGSRCIELLELRGIGLGSFFMATIIYWTTNFPDLPVAPIYMSIDHARTPAAKNSRNRFWTKLGFELDLDETNSFGKSKPMSSSQLIQPDFKLAKGWRIEEMG